MTAPFIFVSTSRVKDGKLGEYETYTRETLKIIEASEPRLLGFATYVSEDGSKAMTVQIHPDAESMVFHMQLMREQMATAFEHIETESVAFCGELNEQVLAMARQIAGSGVPLLVNSYTLGGFTRLASG